MLRRFNFTNRRRIRRSDISVSIEAVGTTFGFYADLSGLRNYGLPSNSFVFIEAYRQTNWMRFPFGRVGAIQPPTDRTLTQFDSPEGILFRVKVTPEADTHKLLAEADRIPLKLPDQDELARQPLLPVKSQDMPDEVFRLDFSGDSPILLISKQAGNYAAISTSPAFISLVLPGLLREILQKILLIERYEYDESDLEDWHSKWLKFGALLPGAGDPPSSSEESEEAKLDWIERAVSGFGKKIGAQHKFKEFWTED